MYERSADLSINRLLELLIINGDVALIFSMSFSEIMREGIENDVRKTFPYAEVSRDLFDKKRMIIRSRGKEIESNQDALSYLNLDEAF